MFEKKPPLTVFADLGYGYTKPYRQSPFPSIVVETELGRFLERQDAIEFNTPFIVSIQEGTFALGYTAMAASKVPKTIMEGRQRWKTIEYKALMLGAIAKQLPKGNGNWDVYLVTGLPYLQSKSLEEGRGLKDTFERKFRIDTMEDGLPAIKTINIVRVDVLSQPRGSYYALVPLTGRRIKNELALIADLGFKSLDYLLLDKGQETDDSNGEDSIAGMERIYTGLIRELRTSGAPSLHVHEVDDWMDKGHLSRYRDIINRHFQEAADKIVTDMKDKLGSSWKRIEARGVIYFVGGSAQRLKPFLEKSLEGMKVNFIENSQQLIVEGYGAYGRAMSRKLWGVD